MLRTKSFPLELKASDEGLITGKASVYGVLDAHNDIVMPGAFTKSLQASGFRVPILNQHDQSDPIGTAILEDTPGALLIKEGRLVLDLPSAREALVRVKAGLVTGFSIGYETESEGYANGARQLKQLKLWEVSLVTFPACDPARVTSVKARFGAELKAMAASADPGLAQAMAQCCALLDALDSVMDECCAMLGLPADSDEMDAMAKAAVVAEGVKAGRVLSASNSDRVKAAMDAMQSAMQAMQALMDAAADGKDKDQLRELKGIADALAGFRLVAGIRV